MAASSLLLAALSYGLFYAAAPGRQASRVVASPRLLRTGGVLAGGLAFMLAAAVYGGGVGSVLVLTVMMTTGSVLAVAGPFLFVWAAPANPVKKAS